jgi:hypothetical protein
MNIKRLLSASGAALLSTAALLALAPSAKAAIVTPPFTFTVTLNLSALAGNLDGPFSLDLQLAQGSGNVVNTVTASNFAFVGGTTVGSSDFSTGGETGSIGTGGTVTLTNSSQDNEIAEEFSAGTTQITFNVSETPNNEIANGTSPIPDQFNVSIFGEDGNNVATTDGSGANELVTSDLGEDATVENFSIVATPEPGSFQLSLVAAGSLLGLALLRRRYSA